MVRSKLMDAETQRDIMKTQLAELSSSSEEQRVQVAKDQDVRSLSILIEKRKTAEQKAALLAVSLLEGRADTLRLKNKASLMEQSSAAIEAEIADMHLETRRLNDELERHRECASDKKDVLDQCKLSCSQFDEEDSALRIEVQVLQDAVKGKRNTIRDIFVKYAQSGLVKKLFDSAPIAATYDEGGCDDANADSAVELETAVRVEMSTLQEDVRSLLGEESLRLLEEGQDKDKVKDIDRYHGKHLAASRSVTLSVCDV